MSPRTLATAGWIAMISAFIAIPFAYFTFKLEDKADAETIAIQFSMQLFGVLLFIVITRYLKKLLNVKFAFHETDRQISMLIMANVGAGFLVSLGLLFPPLKETLGSAAMVVMVFMGIIQIQFGYRLQKLPDNLGGMLKPFCYTNMVTGVCVASVVLIIVGVVVSAISDLMLGTIFFNIAKLARDSESTEIEF